jgi:hypothetical protein
MTVFNDQANRLGLGMLFCRNQWEVFDCHATAQLIEMSAIEQGAEGCESDLVLQQDHYSELSRPVGEPFGDDAR